MSCFILKPARILQTHLSVIKAEQETYTFEELVTKLVPSRDRQECLKLGRLRCGAFVGQVRSSRYPKKLVVFILHNLDNSGNIDFVLKADPSFADRLVCAYKVEHAQFDSKITESTSEHAA